MITDRKPEPLVAAAISMAALCQSLYCLPFSGGLLDQDSLHVYMIQCVLMAQAEKMELERKRNVT